MADGSDYALSLSPEELARYRLMAAMARDAEAGDWAAAGIGPGARVADVGCGPGAIAVTLAAEVTPAGSVDAVDRDPEALTLAERVVEAAGTGNVRLRSGSADDTGLPAGAYDTVMLRHVLAHNGGREQAIVDHLATLARPGGWVYLLDVEATALRSRHTSPDLDDLNDRYLRFHAERGDDLSVGLRLGDLLRDAGLVDVHHRGWYTIIEAPPGLRPPAWAALPAMSEAGLVGPGDVERWEKAFAEADQAAIRPTMFLPTFLARGRHP